MYSKVAILNRGTVDKAAKPEFLKVADTQTHVFAKLSTTCPKFLILKAKL